VRPLTAHNDVILEAQQDINEWNKCISSNNDIGGMHPISVGMID